MEESWLLYFFHSIWQTVPLWLKEPSSSWLLAIELGSPKEHNTGIRPNHSVLGMVPSALKSLWCHKLVYNCAAASAVAAECICHAGSAGINNTIVILGAGILFSAILYLLHWTVLNFLLPELDSEAKSSAGVWNCPPDDCLLLFLLWVFFFLWSTILDFPFQWSALCSSSLWKFKQVSEAWLPVYSLFLMCQN